MLASFVEWSLVAPVGAAESIIISRHERAQEYTKCGSDARALSTCCLSTGSTRLKGHDCLGCHADAAVGTLVLPCQVWNLFPGSCRYMRAGRWMPRGAHLLLQIRMHVLNGDWEATFRERYPGVPCCSSAEGTMLPCQRQLGYDSVSTRLGQVLGFERSVCVPCSSTTP
jgi:hypothetical protein